MQKNAPQARFFDENIAPTNCAAGKIFFE